MKNYVLIGGGLMKEKTTEIIDDYLISLSDKKLPKIIYIPYASLDNPNSIQYFIDLYKGKTQIEILEFSKKRYQHIELEKIFSTSDILYIGGGATIRLVELFKEYNLKDLIEKNLDHLIVAGISAGAIILSNRGLADYMSFNTGKENFNYQLVDGIGLINIDFCPHYNIDERIIFNDLVGQVGIALSDDTAVHITTNSIKLIKSKKNQSGFLFKDGEIIHLKDLEEVKISLC